MTPTIPAPTVEDGCAVINGKPVKIPNITLTQVVASGANGVVFRASSPVRPDMAVKIWIKLRPQDDRDKLKQALFEAQKACAAETDADHHAVRVYDGGDADGYFFLSMEFFDGIPLKQWLKECKPPLAVRWGMCRQLVKVVNATAKAGIIHGDMHGGNILVRERLLNWAPDMGREFKNVRACPEFRVIDYGTSVWTGATPPALDPWERHWTKVSETIDLLLAPHTATSLKVNAFRPSKGKPDDLVVWNSFMQERLKRVEQAASEAHGTQDEWIVAQFNSSPTKTAGWPDE